MKYCFWFSSEEDKQTFVSKMIEFSREYCDMSKLQSILKHKKENNMSDVIDAKISELFAVLNKKKEELVEAENSAQKKWKTNCSFPSVFGSTQPINIQTQTELALVELLSDLMIHQDYQRKAAATLGSTVQPQWGGFLVEDWIEDFKTRVAKIQLVDKKKELTQLEKRLDAIVSPEQRRAMELAEITKSLGV